MIDWSKPIETWNGKPASVVWPNEADMKTVEIECGRWSYNMDGTPIGHSYGRLRNALKSQRHEPQMTQNPDGTTTWTDNAGSETR